MPRPPPPPAVNRWSFRVCAYVGLLTDEYTPFRLSE
jgi:hypothetical protein